MAPRTAIVNGFLSASAEIVIGSRFVYLTENLPGFRPSDAVDYNLTAIRHRVSGDFGPTSRLTPDVKRAVRVLLPLGGGSAILRASELRGADAKRRSVVVTLIAFERRRFKYEHRDLDIHMVEWSSGRHR